MLNMNMNMHDRMSMIMNMNMNIKKRANMNMNMNMNKNINMNKNTSAKINMKWFAQRRWLSRKEDAGSMNQAIKENWAKAGRTLNKCEMNKKNERTGKPWGKCIGLKEKGQLSS